MSHLPTMPLPKSNCPNGSSTSSTMPSFTRVTFSSSDLLIADSAGNTFSGTWTVEENPATGEVYGTWTLSGGKTKTVIGGTWSANKSPKGWDGAWRAVGSDKKAQYSGTWSASVQLKPDARFADLFEAAVKDLVGGGWKSAAQSGSWSIQAFR